MVTLNLLLQELPVGIDPVVGLLILSVIFLTSSLLVYKKRSSELSYEDLDSEEKEVVDLINSNGGKLKQKEVSDNLGWEDTKTSRITSSLVKDDFVIKSRSERENYIKINNDKSERSE